MNAKQAAAYLRTNGFPDLFVSKAEGIWYLLGDDGVTNLAAERCLHVVRTADLTTEVINWKLRELTS